MPLGQNMGVTPSGSGHSPEGGAASSTASPAKPSVPNAKHWPVDPARGNLFYCPAPPILGGGVKPTEWLESMAAADDKKKAHARAREARAIATWLKRLARWMDGECYEVPPAIAIEARQRTDRADGLDPKGESAGPQDIAQRRSR